MPLIRRIIFLFAATLSCLSAPWASAEVLTLGTLNEGIRSQVRQYDPLLDYLKKALRDKGVTDVRLMVFANAEQMADAMVREEVDIFIDSPLVAAKVSKLSGATPFLRRWRDGISSYYSVIIARADSDINSIQDLKGRRIAFEDKDSTSGFLLPAYMIGQRGIPMRELRNHKQNPAPGEVGYVLTYKDKNTLFALVSGRVDAGATDHTSFLDLQKARPNEFRVIASSQSVPRSVLMHRPGLDPELLEHLRQTLTTMFKNEDGRHALKIFGNTAGFDAFPSGASKTFAPIVQIIRDLEDMGIR